MMAHSEPRSLMRKSTPTQSVPRSMQATYAAITTLTDAFCREHLNEDYRALAQSLTLHPGQACSLGPRHALKRVGDGKQAQCSAAIPRARRSPAKVGRRVVLTDLECGHGNALRQRPPSVTESRQSTQSKSSHHFPERV